MRGCRSLPRRCSPRNTTCARTYVRIYGRQWTVLLWHGRVKIHYSKILWAPCYPPRRAQDILRLPQRKRIHGGPTWGSSGNTNISVVDTIIFATYGFTYGFTVCFYTPTRSVYIPTPPGAVIVIKITYAICRENYVLRIMTDVRTYVR